MMRAIDELASRIAGATARDRALIAARRGVKMNASGDQLQALLDLTDVLDRAGFAYALIGGIAVAIHSAQPRATVDVDVAVSTVVSREAVNAALASAGFVPSGTFTHSLNFRHRSGEPVQVCLDPHFDPMISRAESVSVGGSTVRIVTVDDLIETKERASQDPSRRKSKALRDQADIELLKGDVGDPDEGW